MWRDIVIHPVALIKSKRLPLRAQRNYSDHYNRRSYLNRGERLQGAWKRWKIMA